MPARRRSPNNASADENPQLLVSVQEAREALEATIAEGNTLLAISISNQAEFDAAKSKKYTWGEYNLALLSKLFSTDTLVREYRGLAIGGGGSLSLTEETTFLRRDVQSDVRTLESVVNRLNLYQDPTIEIAAARAPASVAGTTSEPNQVDPRKVFVVHGRNERIRSGIFSFLRALRLEPIEWEEAVRMTGMGTPYVGDVLDVAFANAQAIVIVMTPDDEGKLRDEFLNSHDPEYEKTLTPQARQNVVFETGLALGREPKRTIVVEIGRLRPFSDIIGRHTIRLDGSPRTRHALAERLRTAECQVDTTGDDWLTEGDLDADAIDAHNVGSGPQMPVSRPPQPGTQVVDGIERAGTRLPPKLEIVEAVEANMGQGGRGWALLVRNMGLETATGCHGRLEDIQLETAVANLSMENWPKHRDLHWSGQVEGASDYEIPGGQAATLNIIYCDSSGNLTLAYRAPEQFRMDHRITFDSPVLVLVNVTSAGSIPGFVVCRIAPKSLSDNIYRGISGEQPFTLLWQGDERRSLAEFQVG